MECFLYMTKEINITSKKEEKKWEEIIKKMKTTEVSDESRAKFLNKIQENERRDLDSFKEAQKTWVK